MTKLFIAILLVSNILLFAEEIRTINFTPLPMKNSEKTIEEFLPLVDYFNSNNDLKIKYNYKSDYSDIIEGFKKQQIDIAYLGPLPLAILKSQYPYVKPIVSIRQKNGKVSYRCVISKFSDDALPINRPFKVALTQPLSTCGYYTTRLLFKKEFAKDLASQQYKYTMSHTNALLETLKGNFDIAGASEAIAEKFTSLDMKIISRSDRLPGFAIVVNTKTLSENEIANIQKMILGISKNQYIQWGAKLKYGFEVADEKSYDSININLNIPKIGNMQ